MRKNRYLAWDRTIFEDVEKGMEYDRKAWISVCNEIHFFLPDVEKCRTLDYPDFVNIPKDKYCENMAIFHTDSIEMLFVYFLFSPIIYCHSDKAAAILNGIINANKSFYGIRKGFLFYDDNKLSYLTVKELDKDIVSSPEFEKLFNTIRVFVRGNV